MKTRSARTMVAAAAIAVTTMLGTATAHADNDGMRQRIVHIAMREYSHEVNDGNVHAVPGWNPPCNFYTGHVHPDRAGWLDGCYQGWARGEWCADFITYTWQEAGGVDTGGLDEYADSYYRYGRAHNTFHALGDGYYPQIGDAVLFHNDKGQGTGHVALVTVSHLGGITPDKTTFGAINPNAGEGAGHIDKKDYVIGYPGMYGFVSPVPR